MSELEKNIDEVNLFVCHEMPDDEFAANPGGYHTGLAELVKDKNLIGGHVHSKKHSFEDGRFRLRPIVTEAGRDAETSYLAIHLDDKDVFYEVTNNDFLAWANEINPGAVKPYENTAPPGSGENPFEGLDIIQVKTPEGDMYSGVKATKESEERLRKIVPDATELNKVQTNLGPVFILEKLGNENDQRQAA